MPTPHFGAEAYLALPHLMASEQNFLEGKKKANSLSPLLYSILLLWSQSPAL